MAGESDNNEDPFVGFVDLTNAPNEEHPGNVAQEDSASNDDDDQNDDDQNDDDQNDEEDHGDDDEGEEGSGSEGSEEGDDDDDGDDDSDEDAGEHGEGSGDDGADEDDDGEDGDPEPKKKRKLSPQQRINQIRRREGDATRRAEAAEAELAEFKAKQKNLTSDDENDNDGDDEGSSTLVKPDVTDTEKYPYGELDTQYQEDLTDYKVDLRLEKRDAKHAAEEQEEVNAQEAQEWQNKYTAKIEEGEAAYDDFDKVVVQGSENNEFPLTPETAMMALDSPVGHHVIYKIATSPKLADKMARMSLVEQAKQFGRLEARFSTKTPKKQNNKTPNTSNPPSRRKGGGGVKKFDVKSASFADFEKNENAKARKRPN